MKKSQKLIHLTDLHLDHVSDSDADAFVAKVRDERPTGLLVGGDISVSDGRSRDSLYYLQRFCKFAPTYFLLGNHDYYSKSRGSAPDGATMEEVRHRIRVATAANDNLFWLEELKEPVDFGEGTFLVGSAGWGDCRFGDYWDYRFHHRMNDSVFIPDLKLYAGQLLEALVREGCRARNKLFGQFQRLDLLDKEIRRLLVLTHVPPLPIKQQGFLDRRVPDYRKDYRLHYSCKALWEGLHGLKKGFLHNVPALILSGHAHICSRKKINNMLFVTREAEYGHPEFFPIDLEFEKEILGHESSEDLKRNKEETCSDKEQSRRIRERINRINNRTK